MKETNEYKNHQTFATASVSTFSGYYKNDMVKATASVLTKIEQEKQEKQEITPLENYYP